MAEKTNERAATGNTGTAATDKGLNRRTVLKGAAATAGRAGG